MTPDYVNARKAYLDRLRAMRRRELENLSSVDFDLFSSRFDPLIEEIATEVQELEKAQEHDPMVVHTGALGDVNKFSQFRVVYVCNGQVSFDAYHTTGNSGHFGWEFPLPYGSNWCVGAQNSRVEEKHDLNSGYQYLSA
jgi:hypothetical protein